MEKITKESINLAAVDKMCRTCLWQTDETKSLFSVLDDNRFLSDILLSVANINVRKDDNLPKQICAECEMFIHKADQFKRRCLESEEILNEVLNEAKLNSFDDKTTVKFEVPTEEKVVDVQYSLPAPIDGKKETKFTTKEGECKNMIKLELNDESEITEYAEDFDNVFDVEPMDYKSEGMNVDDIFAKFFDKNYKPKKRIRKNTHKDVTRKKLKEKEETKFQCHLCMRKFTKKNSLIIHIEKHEENSKIRFTCDLCKREFQRQVSLDKHIISVHTRRKGYRCDICLKMLPTEEMLETHKNMHKTEKKPTHNCKFCNKAFYMMSTLKDHLRTHTGEKPYLCSICGKGFSQKNNLAQHVRRHQGEKPFKCNECERSFVSKGELQAHKRKHTGAHPFVCDDCGNGFTTSSSLVKHRRTHTGERPYACDMCPMKFAASGTLKTHRRTHTGEKPYQCSYCEKAFAQRNDLVTHIRCHTGERPFVCTTCGLSFRKASALKSHVGLHCKEPQRDVTLNVLQGVNVLLNR